MEFGYGGWDRSAVSIGQQAGDDDGFSERLRFPRRRRRCRRPVGILPEKTEAASLSCIVYGVADRAASSKRSIN